MNAFRSRKREALARAESLVQAHGTPELRYACLEIRLCLEAIAYEKLATYSARIPPSTYRTWQPPQLLRQIERLEPRSTEDFVLRVKREASADRAEGSWRSLGTHRTIRPRRLRKLYNKVGHYLHLSQPKPGARSGHEAKEVRSQG